MALSKERERLLRILKNGNEVRFVVGGQFENSRFDKFERNLCFIVKTIFLEMLFLNYERISKAVI